MIHLKHKPIFPVDRATKKPAVEWKVYQDRPPSKAEIKEWQSNKPGANLGMATGHLSGVIVVDCDSLESVSRFIKSHPEAKTTRQVATGRGRHFYFQHCDGVRNDAGRLLGAGIDVRGEGGFVIVPPSRHANGKQYEYINRSRPIPLPDQLKELLAGHSKGNGSNDPPPVVEQPIKDGQRNDTLASMAGAMRRKGMSQEAIFAALKEENTIRCDPPLPEAEVDKIAASIARYAPEDQATPQHESSVSAPKERGRAGTKLQTWKDYLSSVSEEREWTVEGILPDSGLVVLGGRGKHGKSTLAIHKSRAISLGELFLGRPTKKKPVIYVNYEMPSDYLGSLLNNGEIPEDAYIIDRPDPVLKLETVKRLIGQVGGSGVMVIDSFRGAFKLSGDLENSSGGAGVILRKLQDLALLTGWLIIVIHHSNRSSREGTDSISGTSDWIAAPDVIMTWSRPDPEKEGTLVVEGRIPPMEPLKVILTPDECRYLGTTKEHDEEGQKQRILDILGTELLETDKVIAAVPDIPPPTVRKRLGALYDEMRVHRDGEGKSKHPYLWSNVVSAQTPPYSAGTELTQEPRVEAD